jgi:hypothetical protein
MTIQTDTTPGTLTMREAMYYTLSRPGEHGDHRLRHDCAAGRERALAREFTPLNDKQKRRSWWRSA